MENARLTDMTHPKPKEKVIVGKKKKGWNVEK